MHSHPDGFQITDSTPPGLVEEAVNVAGMTLRVLRPEHGNREDAIAKMRGHYERQYARVGPAIAELRRVVGAHEPIELLKSVCVRASTRMMSRTDSLADDPGTHTWPAKVEYLVGVALSVAPGTGSTPKRVTDRICALIDVIFDGTHGYQMLSAFDEPSTGNTDLDETLFILRLERLTDRMPGYAAHLERIDAEVFDRHRAYYVAEIGFNPADVNRVVRRQLAINRERSNRAMQIVQRYVGVDVMRAAKAMTQFIAAMEDSRTWTPASVHENTGVAAGELQAMFDCFSTSFGSQPDFRNPLDQNMARTNPVIKLPDGVYFVPDPYTLQEAVHNRLASMSTAEVDPKVARYLKHRQDGHERLVALTLRNSFPPETVHERQYFTAEEGRGEIDVLVRSSTPLIVEAKAHRLTDAGRRGAPARVATVAKAMLERALTQTGLAARYINEGGRSFASRQGGPPTVQLVDVEGTIEIIVTFERMDPLAMLGPALLKSEQRAVLIVGIADLLMVADVLRDGVVLHHYARTRAGMTAQGIRVYMESDALGAYLNDRLEPLRSHAGSEPDSVIMLGYTSELINDYFTRVEMGEVATPPKCGLPAEVAAALSAPRVMSSAGWTVACDQVMALDRDTWRKWQHFSRRHRTVAFIVNEAFTIEVGAEPALVIENGVVRLVLGIDGRGRKGR